MFVHRKGVTQATICKLIWRRSLVQKSPPFVKFLRISGVEQQVWLKALKFFSKLLQPQTSGDPFELPDNRASIEGWGQYAEFLGEEMGKIACYCLLKENVID